MLARNSQRGFVILAVNVDQEKKLADTFLEQVPAKFPVVFDSSGDIARRYNVQGMPSSFLVDRNGEIRYAHTGFYVKKISQYEKEISELLADM